MELERIMLREISQKKTNTKVSLICGIESNITGSVRNK